MRTRVVAKVIVINTSKEVLLLRRSETDVRRPLQWDIPGGHTNAQEMAEEAAVRETQEEAGLDLRARNLQLVYATSAITEDDLNVVWLFFIARTTNSTVSLSKEHSEYQWVSLDKAIELLDYERQKTAFTYVRNNDLYLS